MKSQFSHIICHYGEIGIKGNNRSFFEKKLVENIKKSLSKQGVEFSSVRRLSGRVLIKNISNWEKAKIAVESVFGIVNFSPVIESSYDIEDVKKDTLNVIEDKEFDTFAIDTKRSDKNYRLTSTEVNEKVGSAVVENMKKDVDLDNPDLTVYIEIVDNKLFIFTDKLDGPGGLPVGTGGNVLVLMSGGIDSPVAAYLAAKRGLKPFYIHFHSYPHTSKESIEKVRDLVKKLNQYTFGATVYMVPFAEIQKDLIKDLDESMRIIFYRRVMMQIASEIAKKEDCHALITGESLGQVASQTLQNIRAISDTASLPILRPLIGMDKSEIIELAKKIDTFEMSIRLADDVCSRFMPVHPETKASLNKVRDIEKKLDIHKLVEKGITESEREQV